MGSRERRALAARGQRLGAKVTISENEVTEATAQHLRRCFADDELLKVRVNTKDRGVCRALVAQLALRVPCEVVQIIGRVALLFRAAADGDESTATSGREPVSS